MVIWQYQTTIGAQIYAFLHSPSNFADPNVPNGGFLAHGRKLTDVALEMIGRLFCTLLALSPGAVWGNSKCNSPIYFFC